jgi:hypothetical protein
MFIISIQAHELERQREMLSLVNEKRIELIEINKQQNNIIDEILKVNNKCYSSIKEEKIYNPNNLPNGYDLELTHYPKIDVLK